MNNGLGFARKILVLGTALIGLHAAATPVVSWAVGDSTVYGSSNGFESPGQLADNAVLTSQFAASGIVFSGTARANGCGNVASVGWSVFGLSGQNYVNTFGPGCNTNSVVDTLSMKFSNDLSRLAMDAYSHNSGQADLVQMFDDGQLVGSFELSTVAFNGLAANNTVSIAGRQFSNSSGDRAGILLIDGNGTRFDELRFVESSAGANNGNYLFFDNLRYDTAAATVPEPSSLALVVLALAAVGGTARKLRRRSV